VELSAFHCRKKRFQNTYGKWWREREREIRAITGLVIGDRTYEKWHIRRGALILHWGVMDVIF
jgi:hypothetical protein